MSPDAARLRPRAEAVPTLLSGLGVAFALAYVLETAAFSGLDPGDLFSWGVLSGFLTSFPFAVGLVYGGHWLARSDVSPDRYARAAAWCLGGLTSFVALNAIQIAVFTPEQIWVTIGWLRGTATWGAALGLLVGIVEARAIQNAIEAERSAMRAAYLETQRDWLDYLNNLLRHEVLNTAQVVVGYTDVLLADADLDDDERAHLEAIRRQSDDMTDVIEDVRLMIDATHGATDLHPVDLDTTVREELQDLADTYDAVEIETDMVEDATVLADGFLPRVFSNLFSNAVEHNDSEVPRVTVRGEVTGEVAVVRVADNGTGVPPDHREQLFEHRQPARSETGVGLNVVSLLIARYDGDIELTDSGADGSVFTVELPLAREGSPDRRSAREKAPLAGWPAGPDHGDDAPASDESDVADPRPDGSTGG